MAIVAALVAVGCGGGGEGGSAASAKQESAPQTKQEWVQEVSKQCAELHAQREADVQEFQKKLKGEGKEQTEEILEQGLEEVVFPSMHEQATKLAAIEPPERYQAQAKAIWADYSRGIAELEKQISSGNGIGGKSPFVAYQEKASAIGIHDCEP